MAFDCFLKLDGIEGESKDSAHASEIDILGFSWGASQPATGGFGGGSGAGKVSVQDISLIHRFDKASPLLFQACCKGTHIDSAVLTLRKAGDNPLEYLTYTLNEVLVSSVQSSGSPQGGDDVPLETFTLNFSKVQVDYTVQNPDGSAGGTAHGGWDVKQNVAA